MRLGGFVWIFLLVFNIIWRHFPFALQNRSKIIAALKEIAATEKRRLATKVHIRKVHISGGRQREGNSLTKTNYVLYYHHGTKVVTGGFFGLSVSETGSGRN